MILKNAKVYNADFELTESDLLISDGKIAKIAPRGTLCECGEDVIDFAGKVILPGFVEIHIHGCNGSDAGDATPEALEHMSTYLGDHGVTSFCPTSMTISNAELKKVFANIRAAYENGLPGSQIIGINMEGPYISPSKIGAQAPDNVRKPDIAEFTELNALSGGLVKVVDIAPEEDENDAFIKAVSPVCTVSIAHSNANYEQTKHGFEAGVTHVTHLFNQLTPLTHRAPGAVGAAFDNDSVYCEMICDGFHLQAPVLRIAFKQLGEDRTCVISDSCKAAGCPDGKYDLGGQDVFVKDGKALLASGTIAASTANIYKEFKNLISFGIPLRQVIKSCTVNPAKSIGVDDKVGSIAEGKQADLLVMSENYDLENVFIKGVQYK